MKDKSDLKKYLLFFVLSVLIVGAAIFYFNTSDSKDKKTTIIIAPEKSTDPTQTEESGANTTTTAKGDKGTKNTKVTKNNEKTTTAKAASRTKTGTRTTKTQVTTETEADYLFLDINIANEDDLKKLNGIGDTIAKQIINYREEHGRFNNIEEIKNVSGIGENIFEQIKEHIYVDDPTYEKEEEKEITTSPEEDGQITENGDPVDYPMLPVGSETEKAPSLEELSPININIASIEVLLLLPNIDEITAQNIISFRDKCGGYENVYELLLIEGITKNTFTDILPYITIE